MSCGNESALWDIIQFLLDKIHHALGTALPLCQRHQRDPEPSGTSKALPCQVRVEHLGGTLEESPQMKLVELRNIWKEQWEGAELLPVDHGIPTKPRTLSTAGEGMGCRGQEMPKFTPDAPSGCSKEPAPWL